MAVLTRDQFFDRLNKQLGTDTSDDAISFLEDMTDTYNDACNRAENNDGEDWHKKYDELDQSWKEKYKRRFYTGGVLGNGGSNSGIEPEEREVTGENITFDDLFKGKGDK